METYNISLVKLGNHYAKVRYRNNTNNDKKTIEYFVSKAQSGSDDEFLKKTKGLLDMGLDPYKFMSIEMLGKVSGKTRDEARAKAIKVKILWEQVIDMGDEYTLIK